MGTTSQTAIAAPGARCDDRIALRTLVPGEKEVTVAEGGREPRADALCDACGRSVRPSLVRFVSVRHCHDAATTALVVREDVAETRRSR
jgi:hypothetical protein